MSIINTIDELEIIRPELVPNICLKDDSSSKIPKIIHQTWKTKDVPEHWKASHLGWIKLHPEYYYVLWTDDMNLELVKRFYHQFLDTYLNYPYNIQRVDAVRILYLHRYGGIYSDLDIEPLKDISPYLNGDNDIVLLKDIGSFGKWKDLFSNYRFFQYIEQHARYTNMLMASKPGSKFWKVVMKNMLNPTIPWWANIHHFYIMHTTGPFIIHNSVKEYDENLIDHFPYELFQPCTICDEKPCYTDRSYVRLLRGSSWAGISSKIITTCACNWHLIVIVIILVIVAIIIWFMSKNH